MLKCRSIPGFMETLSFCIWAQDILSRIGPNINGGNFENGGSLIDTSILWSGSDGDRLDAFC
jgi:hypothetical protein